MPKFIYNTIILFLIFFLVFNINSFSYAQTYNEFKIDNNFFEPSSYNPVNSINPENPVQEKESQVYFDIGQAFFGYSLSSLLYFPFILIVLLMIGVPFRLILDTFNITSFPNLNLNISFENAIAFIAYATFATINSFFIYYGGKNRKDRSYLYTLVGSITGVCLYFLIIYLLVIGESLIFPDSESSNVAGFQNIGVIFVMPFFVSFISTLFYHLNKKPLETKVSKESVEITFQQFQETRKILDRIKIIKGNVSYNVLQF